MNLHTFTKYAIILAIGYLIISGIIKLINKYSSPIEDYDTIYSVTKVNDSIKKNVKQLDSIKNEKVSEVSNLNNDSTIKLFKKLVSD
jgi:hypothetical protein